MTLQKQLLTWREFFINKIVVDLKLYRCYLCNKTSPGIGLNLRLHRFPKNKELCDLWKERCNLMPYDDVSGCRICSEHFRADDYPEPNHKLLKPNRVPSINVPNLPKKTAIAASSPVFVAVPSILPELVIPPMSPEFVVCSPKTNFAEPLYVGDIKTSNFATSTTARSTWNFAIGNIDSRRTIRKVDHKKLTKTVDTLRVMLSRLKENILFMKMSQKH